MNAVKLVVIPQHERFTQVLTVMETLQFALKFQIPNATRRERDTLANKLITQFDLTDASANLISECSGSQLKRLSVAVEFISKPNVIVLDEPTTGLDSVAAIEVVQHLRSLAHSNQNIAVSWLHTRLYHLAKTT